MMPFINIDGLPGKVYVPDIQADSSKKNACPDCFSCQMCSDSRCRVCTNNSHQIKIHACVCGKSDDEKQPV